MADGLPSVDRHPAAQILEEMADVLESKRHDYAASAWDDNFTGTAHLTGLDPEQVFHVLVGVKVERLRSLLGSKGKGLPRNEPIDDTLLDLANYAALWLAYRRHGTK